MECESISYGIPYSDTFVVVTRVCFTRISDSLSRLRVHVKVNFSDRTRQFLKGSLLKFNKFIGKFLCWYFHALEGSFIKGLRLMYMIIMLIWVFDFVFRI